VSPARRGELNWREFRRAQAASLITCDFFCFETLCLGCLYVPFCIGFGTRQAHLADCTPWAGSALGHLDL
jgi:hypothetical protein